MFLAVYGSRCLLPLALSPGSHPLLPSLPPSRSFPPSLLLSLRTALPGLLCAHPSLGAALVLLTDRKDAPAVLENARESCVLNGLEVEGGREGGRGCGAQRAAAAAATVVAVEGWTWGNPDKFLEGGRDGRREGGREGGRNVPRLFSLGPIE